jgi:hypothetical protein
MIDLSFSFTSQCWLWQSEKAAWHFITLPIEKSEEIRYFYDGQSLKKRGWGAVKVQATIGATSWETAIFPHKESNAYILPIKASVRKAESIAAAHEVNIHLEIKL